jgi:hypothetical protein
MQEVSGDPVDEPASGAIKNDRQRRAYEEKLQQLGMRREELQ